MRIKRKGHLLTIEKTAKAYTEDIGRPFILMWVEPSVITPTAPKHQGEFLWPTMEEIKKLALKEEK